MKLGKVRAVGLIGLLACAAAKAEIVLEGDNRIAESYASDVGISINEARKRLELQDLAAEFQTEVASIADMVYGGLHIQNTPEFKVVLSVTDKADRALIEPLLAGKFEPLSKVVEVRNVKMSLHDLEELVSKFSRITELTGQQANFDIDVIENSAVIISEDPQKFHRALAAARIELPEGIRVRRGTLVKPLAPIGGGESNTNCTFGFSVVHQDGRRGITTAAHCNDTQYYNGVKFSYESERYGVDWDVQWNTTGSYVPTNTVWNGSSYFRITASKGRAGQAVGEYVCRHGRVTGYQCGYIRTTSLKPANVNDIAFSPTWIAVGPMYGVGGDSGAPFFKGSTAYGILRGRYSDEEESRIAYMAADRINTGLNVSVLLVP